MKKFLAAIIILLVFIAPAYADVTPHITAAWNNDLQQVSVEWTGLEKIPDALPYSLYYKEQEGSWEKYYSLSWTSTGKSVTGLKPNTTYYFKLDCIDPQPAQKPSNIVSVTTPGIIEFGYTVQWTGSDIKIEWRNAKERLDIWCANDTNSGWLIKFANKNGSIYMSSVKDQQGQAYFKPQVGEAWRVVFYHGDEQISETVKCENAGEDYIDDPDSN